MHLRKHTLLFCSLLFIYTISSLSVSAQQVKRDDEWVLTSAYGFPIWVGFNDVIQAASGDRRETYMFVETQYFTSENIRKLFAKLATEYEKPEELKVTVFSDKKMLQRAINFSTWGGGL
jgi:hypothetical protein